jgi:signal transduction histidine kinase
MFRPLLALALVSSSVIADDSWLLPFSKELRSGVERMAKLDAALAALPAPKRGNSTPSLGFHTHLSSNEKWIQINFDKPQRADSIVLVPAVNSDSGKPIEGYGLARRFSFRVDAVQGVENFVDQRTDSESQAGGLTPVVLRFTPRDVQRIRIIATEPWPEASPLAVLALSEIMVLNGVLNVASLGTLNPKEPRYAGTEPNMIWSGVNLLDHETPLGLPVLPSAEKWKGYASRTVATNSGSKKEIILDLGSEYPLDEIRLVPAHLPDLPHWNAYGFPDRFDVDVSSTADFVKSKRIYDGGNRFDKSPGANVVVAQGRKFPARYVRIHAFRLRERARDALLALAEIQVFSGQRNVALGVMPQVTDSSEDSAWSPAALTDGLAPGGKLISWQEWFTLLRQRRDLEAERAVLQQQLPLVRSEALRVIIGSAALAVGGIASVSTFILWRRERRRKREEKQLHDRLARDLHDEIGSNLGSIALLTGFAKNNPSADSKLLGDLILIEEAARESAASMREMVKLLKLRSGLADGNWLEVLRSLSQRLLIHHEVKVEFAESLPEPGLQKRREIYLICKEGLHNIAKHAAATEVSFVIERIPTGLRVLLKDNGKGFDSKQGSFGDGLQNMAERAKQLGGTLSIHPREEGGTVLTLEVPL